MPDKPAVPFPSDIEYITAEIDHIRARARRIGVQRRIAEIENDLVPLRGVVGKAAPTEPEELRRVLDIYEQAEQDIRTGIDKRLALNRTTGSALGLDDLCAEHGLGVFERTLLLLSTIATMGDDIANAIDSACPRGMCGSWVCAEHIWSFMEFNVEERIRSRLVLLPTAPLLRAGLVTLDLGRSASPSSLADARIEVTAKSFALIVGVPEIARVEDSL